MKLTEDNIPDNILAAAKQAGLRRPDWYVGPRKRPVTLKTGLGKIVDDVRAEMGLDAAELEASGSPEGTG